MKYLLVLGLMILSAMVGSGLTQKNKKEELTKVCTIGAATAIKALGMAGAVLPEGSDRNVIVMAIVDQCEKFSR